MNRRQLLLRSTYLMGGMVSASVARAVLAGESAETAIKNPVFKSAQRRMLASLTELIIPATDTPGALAAGVPQFVELMVSDWYKEGERKIFFNGLDELQQFCKEKYQKDFNACSVEQQTKALQQAEQQSLDYKAPQAQFMSQAVDEKSPFFTKIKEMTVVGYYTSEVGAKQELSYLPMPMKYDGDFDFAEVGRQWSS